MDRKKTSLSLDEKLWKDFKKRCIDLDKQYSEVLEDLIRKFLNQKI